MFAGAATIVFAPASGGEIDIAPRDHDPEFEAWRWAPVEEVLDLIVPFKRPVYTAVIAEFRELARPG